MERHSDASVAQNQMKDVKTASEIMNVSSHGLYKKIREGKIPAYRFGRKVLIDMEEVKRAMRIKTADSQDGTK